MHKILLKCLNSHDNIIILRHIQPDFDAIGSQMSLVSFIHDNFANKRVKTGGQVPDEYTCIAKQNTLNATDFQDALVIITDTATQARIDIDDIRWLALAKTVLKIDHHVDVDAYADYQIVDNSYPATCELLTELFSETGLVFSKQTAFYLFHGLVTDTERFMYRNVTSRTFQAAQILTNKQIDISDVYNNIYGLSNDEAHLKGYILSNFKTTDHGIVYLILTNNLLQQFNISDPHRVALWVNILGEIKHAQAWILFVEGEDFTRVELRSNHLSVREVAQHFGGGGHVAAAGIKLSSIEQANDVINYFERNLKEKNG